MVQMMTAIVVTVIVVTVTVIAAIVTVELVTAMDEIVVESPVVIVASETRVNHLQLDTRDDDSLRFRLRGGLFLLLLLAE